MVVERSGWGWGEEIDRRKVTLTQLGSEDHDHVDFNPDVNKIVQISVK